MDSIKLSDIIIIILLLISILLWIINLVTKYDNVDQQKPQIIYRFRPDLDLQFDKSNFPSKIYNDMFTGSNISQGGMSTDQGRSTVSVLNQNIAGGTIKS